jgi:hypothetical protein
MKHKSILIALVTISIFSCNSFGQNRLNSRLFYSKPPLFYSKSKTSIDLSKYEIDVSKPIDNREQFYGEVAYKNKKVQPLDEFFEYPTMIEIQRKIIYDLRAFGMSKISSDSTKNKISIKTIVEVFYPDVRGFIWGKSFAKVRLLITAKSNESELINKKYESFYITAGTDKEFEGSMMMTIEQGANVTIGMALRKALDEFYNDLNEKIKTNPNTKES